MTLFKKTLFYKMQIYNYFCFCCFYYRITLTKKKKSNNRKSLVKMMEEEDKKKIRNICIGCIIAMFF